VRVPLDDARGGREGMGKGGSMKSGWLVLAVLASFALGACASAAPVKGPGATLYHLGRGTERQVLDVVPMTLYRFGLPVASYRETPNGYFFDTSWVHRLPYAGEVESGVEVVRSRVTVEARRVGRLYSVWLRVENAGLDPSGKVAWERLASTDELDAQVEKITIAIKDEIDTGLRVY
jgi:hypothetical protein